MKHLDVSLLCKYLEDDLDDYERDRVEMHLLGCALCSEQLADVAILGAEEELFELEHPSVGLVESVMMEISGTMPEVPTQVASGTAGSWRTTSRFSSKLEVFKRFVTAAVVTGFMMLGTYQAAKAGEISVVHTMKDKVENVSSDTEAMFLDIHTWFSQWSDKLIK